MDPKTERIAWLRCRLSLEADPLALWPTLLKFIRATTRLDCWLQLVAACVLIPRHAARIVPE